MSEFVHLSQLEQHGPYFLNPGQDDIPIRNRASVKSANPRGPEYLPPLEIRAAVQAVIRSHLSIAIDDVAAEVAKAFGFKSTSGPLRQVIEEELRFLVEDETVEEHHGRLYLSKPASKALARVGSGAHEPRVPA